MEVGVTRAEAYRGCLLAGAVGDALGAPVEFLKRAEIVARFGEPGIRDFDPAYGKLGAITDDTQMTLFTADGLLRAWVRAMSKGIGPIFSSITAESYLRWLHTQGLNGQMAAPLSGWLLTHPDLFHLRAPGRTCVTALQQMKRAAPAENHSKGCGAVMRMAPVGMFAANWSGLIDQTFHIGSELAALTHGHPTGFLTAGVLAVIVKCLLEGKTLPEAMQMAKEQLRRKDQHEETFRAIEQAESLAQFEPGSASALPKLGQGWVAEEALAIALYCALSTQDLESALVLAVNHDGDSDSTGSITGNLVGCVYGVQAIPQRWLADLELRSVIETVAADLATFQTWDDFEPRGHIAY